MEYEIEEPINPRSWQDEQDSARSERAPLLRWKPVQQKRAMLIPESEEA
ncbi:hypothetical protein [Novosphingobium olei]|uniref:Uncharacterized protein n=1 Tax=Novosphingobium olei TaxID=2728851 RepID=A0A7Y0BPF5_9SPHN|nr:hypothetical protein [Novosphingobium olei]NML93496.1 hypothetical protein [Novosphingobium olei]BEV00154.1 hypothetical protein NSDW_12480 [Novosphingobium olei]